MNLDNMRALLEHALLAPDPGDLAHALYGPTWDRETVRKSLRDKHRWTTRRYPHGDAIARLLRPALHGVIAHDGRSTRETTASGWWLNHGDSWEPTTSATISGILASVLTPILTIAVTVANDAEEHLAAAQQQKYGTSETSPAHKQALRHYEEALDAASSANLRVAVISSLVSSVSESGRRFGSTLQHLAGRTPGVTPLALPEDVLATVALDWLFEAIDLGELTPSRANRITVADVRTHWETTARHGTDALPLQLLYRGLDTALGARIRRVEWQLPAADEDTDEEPLTVLHSA